MATINNRAGSIALEFCCAAKGHEKDVTVDGRARKTPDIGLHILPLHLISVHLSTLTLTVTYLQRAVFDMMLSVKQMKN